VTVELDASHYSPRIPSCLPSTRARHVA